MNDSQYDPYADIDKDEISPEFDAVRGTVGLNDHSSEDARLSALLKEYGL